MSIIFFFINGHPFAKKTITPTNKEVAELLEEIRDKTEKYNIERYSFDEDGINLAITGNQKYYHSVKNNVEHIVKNTIKSTVFEEYPILIEKGKLEEIDMEEAEKGMDLVNEVSSIVKKDLYESFPNQIERLNVGNIGPSRFSFEMFTNLEEKQESKIISQRIEDKINELLDTKLASNELINEWKYPFIIDIYNKKGEKIN